MNLYISYRVIIIVFTVCSFRSAKEIFNQNCSVSVSEANRCAKIILQIGNRDAFIPRNSFEEGSKYCKMMNDNIRCIANHAKCYTPFTRQCFGIFLRSMKKEIKNQCNRAEDREMYMKHVACIRNHKIVEKVHQCMDKLYAILYYVEHKVDVVKQIPCGCCGYQLFRDCMLTEADKVCRERTGPETALFIANVARNMTGDILDLLCSAQDSLSTCESKYGDCVQTLRNVMSTAKPSENTILFPLIGLAVTHDN